MNNKKMTLLYIIILLCIFIPLSLIGIYYNFFEELPTKNTSLEKGYIYFYDNNNQITSSYKCNNINCKYATYTTDDDEYSLEYYKSENNISTIINNKYAFIEDDNIKLYDIETKEVIEEFDYIKNYGIGINDGIIIAKKSNSLWGIISLKDNYNSIVNFEYDYIGLYKNIDENTNKLSSTLYAVLKENKWNIISNTEILFETDNQITSYTKNYISTINENKEYYTFNYANKQLNTLPLLYSGFINDYSIVVNNDNQLYVKDIQNNKVLTDYITLVLNNYIEEDNKAFDIILDNNELKITVYGEENPREYTYQIAE